MSGLAAGVTEKRAREVWARLEGVTDPELDESVTELDFVTGVEVDQEGDVRIGFRLPTYWCAANFSFLMADDMRRAVLELPWVAGVTVELGEHMYAQTINAGLARGLSFQETFGAEADGDLDELRRTFLLKAFQRRQAALLGHLLGAGHSAEALAGLTLAELAVLDLDPDGRRLLVRYEERRGLVGPRSPAAPRLRRHGGSAARARNPAGLSQRLAAGGRQCRIQRRPLPRLAGGALRHGDALRATPGPGRCGAPAGLSKRCALFQGLLPPARISLGGPTKGLRPLEALVCMQADDRIPKALAFGGMSKGKALGGASAPRRWPLPSSLSEP